MWPIFCLHSRPDSHGILLLGNIPTLRERPCINKVCLQPRNFVVQLSYQERFSESNPSRILTFLLKAQRVKSHKHLAVKGLVKVKRSTVAL